MTPQRRRGDIFRTKHSGHRGLDKALAFDRIEMAVRVETVNKEEYEGSTGLFRLLQSTSVFLETPFIRGKRTLSFL